MRQPGREWLARLGLLLVSSLAALAAAEVALRVLEPPRQRMFRFNERTLYELVPGTERRFTHLEGNGGHAVETRINSRGFRGAELEPAPERRLVVYGDSFIQAEFSALPDTFAARLAVELDARCPWRTEVVNAGVIGYGPDQVLRKMESELPRLEPDLAVVAIFADNDFGDLLRNKIFELGRAGDLRENPPHLSRTLAKNLGLERDLALLRQARKAYWRWLIWRRGPSPAPAGDPAAARVGAHRIDQWLEESRQEYESYVVEGDRVVRRIDYDHYDADMALFPDSESARYKTRLFEAVLGRMSGLLARHGQDALALIIPSPIDLCDDYDFDVDEAKYPLYDRRALSRAVEQGARDAGLPHLSLWESFAVHEPNDLYFHHGDNHWNDRGQALAAMVVAEQIVRQAWPGCRAEAAP